MKKLMFVALLFALISSDALAVANPRLCYLKGSVYETAAYARNMKMEPEQALYMASAYYEIPLAEREKIINRVYFDTDFISLSGTPLRMKMMNLCLSAPGK